MNSLLRCLFFKIIFVSIILLSSYHAHAAGHDGICAYGGGIDDFYPYSKLDPITLPSVNWSGPANAIPPAWVTISTNGSGLRCTRADNVTSKMTFTPTTAPTGKFITVNGTSYPIFATPINGIGYILALNTLSYTPVVISSDTTYIGNNQSTLNNGFKFNQRIQLVSTGTLPNGNFTIPSMILGTISIIPTTTPTDGGTIASNTQKRQLISNATTITLAAKTCSPTINNIQVTFPELFIYKDTLWASPVQQNFNLGLNCTQGPINAYVTFSDANTPGNNSNILSLDPTSTASGVGIQIKYNNSPPINYGLDSASAGNSGQILLQGNLSGLSSLPFTASLIKTGTMKAGSFTARATFTFSYQ